ncbi:MAG: hypothetical protein HY855_19665 [Burkholderiales bacterium]|nr:hypothetical protein [Burkholderiales bacterium]
MFSVALTAANPSATFDPVVHACKLAGIHPIIEAVPNGYQTEVGERGAEPSGGQQQRISITRALLKAPKALNFDEAASALYASAAEFRRQRKENRNSIMKRASSGRISFGSRRSASKLRRRMNVVAARLVLLVLCAASTGLAATAQDAYPPQPQLTESAKALMQLVLDIATDPPSTSAAVGLLLQTTLVETRRLPDATIFVGNPVSSQFGVERATLVQFPDAKRLTLEMQTNQPRWLGTDLNCVLVGNLMAALKANWKLELRPTLPRGAYVAAFDGRRREIWIAPGPIGATLECVQSFTLIY